MNMCTLRGDTDADIAFQYLPPESGVRSYRDERQEIALICEVRFRLQKDIESVSSSPHYP